jgi:hypothetical protein
VNETHINVTLELELAGDTLSGRATGPDGSERSFSGWIGLVGVIDGLLGAPSHGAEQGQEVNQRDPEEKRDDAHD